VQGKRNAFESFIWALNISASGISPGTFVKTWLLCIKTLFSLEVLFWNNHNLQKRY